MQGNFAGFTLLDLTTYQTTQIGDRYEQVYIDVEAHLKHNTNSTKLVGFRTTKSCENSPLIKSIQLLYFSMDQNICENILSKILPSNNFDGKCTSEGQVQDIENMLQFSGRTHGVLPDKYKKVMSSDIYRKPEPVQENIEESRKWSTISLIALGIGLTCSICVLIVLIYRRGRTKNEDPLEDGAQHREVQREELDDNSAIKLR